MKPRLIDRYQVQEEEEFTDPYTMFLYAIRSPYTKESYFRRLHRFFDAINFCEGETMDKRCEAKDMLKTATPSTT